MSQRGRRIGDAGNHSDPMIETQRHNGFHKGEPAS
jgi:hypothetical protein